VIISSAPTWERPVKQAGIVPLNAIGSILQSMPGSVLDDVLQSVPGSMPQSTSRSLLSSMLYAVSGILSSTQNRTHMIVL
jgi:hypothetical protein